MRLARWQRVVATALSLWLPFVVGGSAMAYPCQMRSPMPLQHDIAHHHGSRPHGNDQHPCTCVGRCAAGAAASDVPVTSIVTVVVARSRGAGQACATQGSASDGAALLGLYTTGPPVAAAAI